MKYCGLYIQLICLILILLPQDKMLSPWASLFSHFLYSLDLLIHSLNLLIRWHLVSSLLILSSDPYVMNLFNTKTILIYISKKLKKNFTHMKYQKLVNYLAIDIHKFIISFSHIYGMKRCLLEYCMIYFIFILLNNGILLLFLSFLICSYLLLLILHYYHSSESTILTFPWKKFHLR